MFEPVEFLRRQTRLQHEALERQGVFAGIVRPDVRLDDYGRLLDLLWRFYAAVEPAVLRAVASQPEISLYRPRLALLAADMTALGRALPAPGDIALPLASAGQLLGAIYAIEGSALGGQVIARHLRKSLGSEVGGALGFFDGLAVNVGSHWQDVLALLRRSLTGPMAAEDALRGAQGVFSALHGLASGQAERR